MVKKKIVIQVTMPNAKSRADAMALAAKASGVSSVGITGEHQLEVIGEGIDVVCLVNLLREKKPCLVKCLRKPQFCHADVLLVEEVKDKKKEEEEAKKKKEDEEAKKKEEEKKKACAYCPPGTCRCAGYYPMPMVLCEPEQPAGACHIM